MSDLAVSPLDLETGYELPGEVTSVTLVSESKSKHVYRCEFRDESVRFLLVFDPDKRSDVKEALALEQDIGLPESYFTGSDPEVLVMERAAGRALSVLVPLWSVPGIWWRYQRKLESAIDQLGRQMGRLHQATRQNERPAIETASFNKYLTKEYGDDGIFHRQTLQTIRAIQSNLRAEPLETARVYGDRTPHNVYFDGESVTNIDPSMRVDSSLKDVLTAERGIALAIHRLPYARTSQAEQLIGILWDGYLDERQDYQPPDRVAPFRCIMDCSLLSWYHNNTEHKTGAKISKWIDTRLLKRRIRSDVRTYRTKNA